MPFTEAVTAANKKADDTQSHQRFSSRYGLRSPEDDAKMKRKARLATYDRTSETHLALKTEVAYPSC